MKQEKDFASIAKQLIQNPEQAEEIISSFESKMELNPLIKELCYARRFPRDIFGQNIDCAKYISVASSTIDIVLSNMNKDNFSYSQNYVNNRQEYNSKYDLDCVDLGEILAYNPEQINNIIETENALGITALEETLRDIELYPEEWFADDKNVSICEKNASEVLSKIYEFERENLEKRIQNVNTQSSVEKSENLENENIEYLEEKSDVIETKEKINDNLPINESKFAQIYGKAKGRIQEVFSKIKSFIKGKSHEKENNNQDIGNR